MKLLLKEQVAKELNCTARTIQRYIDTYVELVDTGKPKTLKNYLKQGEING